MARSERRGIQMIEVYWGNNKRIDLAFKNDDGSVLDITGATVFFTVKKRFTDSDDSAIISINVTSHDDSANGLTHIDITNDHTKTCAGKYFCDIKLGLNGGFTTFYTDEFKVLEAITRRES